MLILSLEILLDLIYLQNIFNDCKIRVVTDILL